jgi:hypothetical protein
MEDKKKIQEYVNNFRRHLSQYLKPGIGLSCKIYPAQEDGAILDFTIGPDISNEDIFKAPKKTVNSILEEVPQRLVSGNFNAIKFSGTNATMEPNRILLIKGEDDPALWDDKGAKSDVERIINTQTRAHK